jgi:hypothetical protein
LRAVDGQGGATRCTAMRRARLARAANPLAFLLASVYSYFFFVP